MFVEVPEQNGPLFCPTTGSSLSSQAIQDLSLDEATCTVLVTYSLPQHSTRLSAELTARILLTLPGTNGEPAYQDFHLQSLLPGQHGLQHR